MLLSAVTIHSCFLSLCSVLSSVLCVLCLSFTSGREYLSEGTLWCSGVYFLPHGFLLRKKFGAQLNKGLLYWHLCHCSNTSSLGKFDDELFKGETCNIFTVLNHKMTMICHQKLSWNTCNIVPFIFAHKISSSHQPSAGKRFKWLVHLPHSSAKTIMIIYWVAGKIWTLTSH